MYAASGNRGEPGAAWKDFAGYASVTVVNLSGDALTAVASTLLKAWPPPVRLEGASLTPKQAHAFCDHIELLIRVEDEEDNVELPAKPLSLVTK
jgi:hypothetical protein